LNGNGIFRHYRRWDHVQIFHTVQFSFADFPVYGIFNGKAYQNIFGGIQGKHLQKDREESMDLHLAGSSCEAENLHGIGRSDLHFFRGVPFQVPVLMNSLRKTKRKYTDEKDRKENHSGKKWPDSEREKSKHVRRYQFL